MQILLSDWTLGTAFLKIAHYIAYGLYWVLAKLAYLCNLIINLVRALAGLETYWYNGTQINPGESGQGDIIINFVQEQGLINIFIALFVLSIVLLFIVTLVSVIKSEWSPVNEAKGNNKYAVISKSIRALVNFITVPMVSILGIIVGNELLKAFDGATHNGAGDFGISNLMMQCVTENANWVYINDSDARKIMKANEGTIITDGESYTGIYSSFASSGGYDAAAINRAFNQGAQVSTDVRVSVKDIPWLTNDVAEKINDKIARGEAYFSYQDPDMVSLFYKLGNVDFLAGFVVMFFVTKFLFEISFGLVKRIYMLSILILVSPPIVAVTPLQPDALKNWRKQFIANVLSVYGAIIGCNLYFILVPYMRRIQLFKPDWFGNIINSFVTLLFIGAGAMFIKDFSKLITDLIGGGDLYKDSVDKDGSLWKGAGKTAGSAISGFVGAPSRIVSDVGNVFKTAKYEGWGKAAKQTRDSAIKKSGFLQGLTGASIDKDGNVKGVGSSVWKPASKSTREAEAGFRMKAGTDALKESLGFLEEENKGYNEELNLVTSRSAERMELAGRDDLSAEETQRLEELRRTAEEDIHREEELRAKLAQNDADKEALGKVTYNGKKYVSNTPRGSKEANEKRKTEVQAANDVLVRTQARKKAQEDATKRIQQEEEKRQRQEEDGTKNVQPKPVDNGQQDDSNDNNGGNDKN